MLENNYTTKSNYFQDGRMKNCEPRNILTKLQNHLSDLTYAGDPRRVSLVYLVAMTSHLDKPVSLVIKGPSGAGKSHLMNLALDFVAPARKVVISGMSEKALAYLDAGSLKNRALVMQEAAGLQSADGNWLLRTLVSESRLEYMVTGEPGKDGKRTTNTVIQEGPTGLIMTTTADRLHPEDESRMLTLRVDETESSIKAILLAIADDEEHEAVDLTWWHELDRRIEEGPKNVSIPFAHAIAERMPLLAHRVKRDFHHVKSLIKIHALLHQEERARDGNGRVIADISDYEVVYSLMWDVLQDGLTDAISPQVRQTVEAAIRLYQELGRPVRNEELARALGLSEPATSKRVWKARGLRLLENRAPTGKAAELAPLEPLPEAIDILPHPDAVRAAMKIAA